MSVGGSVIPVENLASSPPVAFGAEAKRLLLPMARGKDIATILGKSFVRPTPSDFGSRV